MWIAITYERTTTVITWNLLPSEEEAIAWVVSQLYPYNVGEPPASDAAKLQAIEALGFTVQIEEVTHLLTTTEWAVRYPNELTLYRAEHPEKVYGYAREADEKLRAAGSTERTKVVKRDAAFTAWEEDL